MASAVFKFGYPIMVPYTPGSAVTAGDVVVVGNRPRIAHSDIPASTLGDLADNGAVYEMTGDAAIADGKAVYWNNATGKVTETAGALKLIGRTASACAADAGKCLVAHV